MQEEHNLTDEMIAGRRPDSHGHLPEDMPRWMSHTIVAIDTLNCAATSVAGLPERSILRARSIWGAVSFGGAP